MCPPRPPKSIAQILFEACESLAARNPNLFQPERYYDTDDQRDWAGRDNGPHDHLARRLIGESPTPAAPSPAQP